MFENPKSKLNLLNLENQIQQIKSAGRQPRPASTSPNVISGGAPAMNTPKHVANVRVTLSRTSDVTSKVTVTFKRDPSDYYFSEARAYVSGYKGNPAPVLVGSGQGPISFALENTGEAVSVTVQANGNLGPAPLSTAPNATLKLDKTPLVTVPTPTGTGGGSSPTLYPASAEYPDAPPSSPSPYDDEFGGSALSSQWTAETSGSSSVQFGTRAPSYITADFPTGGTGFYAAREAFALPGGDFNIAAKFRCTPKQNFQGVQIALKDNNSAGFNNALVLNYESPWNIAGGVTQAAWAKWAGGVLTLNGQNATEMYTWLSRATYLMIQRRGGNWDFLVSQDGISWLEVVRGVVYAFSPTQIYWSLNNNYNPPVKVSYGIDWIRYNYFPIL